MTLSDVLALAQIIITPAALIVGYLVFQLQAKTFESQLTIANLENQKFLYSIRPIFKTLDFEISPGYLNQSFIHYQIVLERNSARNFFIENNSDFLRNILIEVSFEFLEPGKQISIFRGEISKQTVNRFLDIRLKFSDEIGTEYFQLITGSWAAPQISSPIVINQNT